MNTVRLLPLLVLTSLLAAVPALAANRTLSINAPATAKPGENIHVIIAAATEAVDAEQIGFFHAEYSIDDGRNWLPVYAEKPGRKISRALDIPAGAAGSKVLVRVRVAFRGGQGGDVDFAGKPIDWNGSWTKWEAPPAKTAEIHVKAR